MWDCTLNQVSEPVLQDSDCCPPMHQISRGAKRDSAQEFLKSEFRPVRYLRKISFGGNLNLFVTPKGSRYRRYCYRYGGKRRTLSLGLYPEVPFERARSRHLAARQLLAAGVDPSLKREELDAQDEISHVFFQITTPTLLDWREKATKTFCRDIALREPCEIVEPLV